MAFYQILYWQNIPTQIKAWDDFDEVKIELSPKFLIKIDQAAREQNLTSEDDYLSQFRWSKEEERTGSPEDIIKALKKEIEDKFL